MEGGVGYIVDNFNIELIDSDILANSATDAGGVIFISESSSSSS